MKHIELAINVLKKEVRSLEDDLKYGRFLPQEVGKIIDELQKLNRAIYDIKKSLGETTNL